MALKIVWTYQAEKGLLSVLEYLENKWTSKEINNLEGKLSRLLERISKYPDLFPVASKFKDVHKALVDKNNYIIYRVNFQKGIIEIINFRGTKQSPVL